MKRRIPIVDPLRLEPGFKGSVAVAEIGPTESVTILINRITDRGVFQIGTVVFDPTDGFELREDGGYELREDDGRGKR